jgi:hypothetical protein
MPRISRRHQTFPNKVRKAARAARQNAARPEQEEATAQDPDPVQPAVRPAVNSSWQRFNVYAMLAWSYQYKEIAELEELRFEDQVDELVADNSSKYMRRQMRAAGSTGEESTRRMRDRMGDTAGALWRSQNVRNIPFTQAVKAVSYTYSRVSDVHWVRERRLRRVAGRPFARTLLEVMADNRPPPAFEVDDDVVSVAFDQTYCRKSGVSTGSSRYSAVQTVTSDGEIKKPERIVYINGQDFPAPAPLLSPAARALIARRGPYTQDFHRVIPPLQPDRVDSFLDTLLLRMVQLIALSAQPGFSTLELMRALLSRPNHNPGGPTYMSFLPAMLNCDTKSYPDMCRIIDWIIRFKGFEPLVLHVSGDGQSVLRMRDLKRLYPDWYQHVLVSNGHFHSSAHFQFATVRLWWLPLLSQCCVLLGKDKVGPDIKDLTGNSYQHTYEVSKFGTTYIPSYLAT